MQPYRAIIVDDERHVRDALDLLLKQFCPEIQLVGFAAPAEASGDPEKRGITVVSWQSSSHPASSI